VTDQKTHTGGKPRQWDESLARYDRTASVGQHQASSVKRQASATIDVYNKTIQEK